MRSQIPNLITLGNLFCGCCALLWVLAGRPDIALWFTLGCFACDTADGLVARALKVSSPIGVQLDSLADAVSFGVVPGALLYRLLAPLPGSMGFTFYPPLSALPEASGQPGAFMFSWAAIPAFILTMAAAYRLAKFNVDTRQTSYFLGLSTPACTVFVVGMALTAFHNRFGAGEWLLANSWAVYLFTGLLSWLMVTEIPLAGMKIKGFGWRGNEALILILLLFLVLLFLIKELAFCAIIVVYIAYSVFNKKAVITA
ncbi:MAG TPA: CDP-alcohol phosphatidyltransferase family protein [Saprospiraceae bacterium]|nr:CDP-alcohol phosphatidyltransferase family protein [Saprospiraceae bacterium]HNM25635.1 CDP-alcohol phosphatidyltransferase family protein [Saprospiraceae bacterium]